MKGQRGFTLIELLVVLAVVVIGIVAIGGGIGGALYKISSKQSYTGKVTDCQQLLNQAMVVSNGNKTSSSVFSFSCDIQSGDEIISFSSEDRKFATVHKGDVIQVVVFKYAPWDISKAGTYYDGRLIKKVSVAQ